MRACAWLMLALGLSGPLDGCSGGYPLPPTPCDELCHVTRGLECSDRYDPAACVLSCEQAHLSTEECRPYFDAQLECFRQNPGAAKDNCYSYTPDYEGRCSPEMDALGLCLFLVDGGNGFEQ